MNTLKKLLYGTLILGGSFTGLTSCEYMHKNDPWDKKEQVTLKSVYTSKVTGLKDSIEFKIAKPRTALDTNHIKIYEETYRESRLKSNINVQVIDGKDTIKLYHRFNESKEEFVESYDCWNTRVTTVKKDKVKLMSYLCKVNESPILWGRSRTLSLGYYNLKDLQYVVDDPIVTYLVASYNLRTLEGYKCVDVDGNTSYVNSTITPEFARLQKIEFGESLYYINAIAQKVTEKETALQVKKTALEKQKLNESYKAQQKTIDDKINW